MTSKINQILDKVAQMASCATDERFFLLLDLQCTVYEYSHKDKPIAIWRKAGHNVYARISRQDEDIKIRTFLRGEVDVPKFWKEAEKEKV